MEIKTITLKLTDEEIAIIFEGLDSYIKQECKIDFYKTDNDAIEWLEDEIKLANELARKFNYKFCVYANKKLKEMQEFNTAEEMIHLYRKVNK